MTKRSGFQAELRKHVPDVGVRENVIVKRACSRMRIEDLGNMDSCVEVGFHLRAFDRCGVRRGFDAIRRGHNGCGVGER